MVKKKPPAGAASVPAGIEVSPPPGVSVQDVDRAHELHTKLQDYLTVKRIAIYQIAGILWEINRCEYYRLMGYESFHQYTESTEISLKKSRAYQLVNFYDIYVHKLGLGKDELNDIGDIDKLIIVGPLVERALSEPGKHSDPRGEISEIMAEANTLSRRDLVTRKKERLGLPAAGMTALPPTVEEQYDFKAFLGARLQSVEPRIEASGAVKLVFTFLYRNGRTRKLVLFASGPDVGFNVENIE